MIKVKKCYFPLQLEQEMQRIPAMRVQVEFADLIREFLYPQQWAFPTMPPPNSSLDSSQHYIPVLSSCSPYLSTAWLLRVSKCYTSTVLDLPAHTQLYLTVHSSLQTSSTTCLGNVSLCTSLSEASELFLIFILKKQYVLAHHPTTYSTKRQTADRWRTWNKEENWDQTPRRLKLKGSESLAWSLACGV